MATPRQGMRRQSLRQPTIGLRKQRASNRNRSNIENVTPNVQPDIEEVPEEVVESTPVADVETSSSAPGSQPTTEGEHEQSIDALQHHKDYKPYFFFDEPVNKKYLKYYGESSPCNYVKDGRVYFPLFETNSWRFNMYAFVLHPF